MERKAEEVVKCVKSRKNEARVLLKRCFKNPAFSFVPFEIWRDILCEGEAIVVVRISQACWGFKELVDNLRELLLEYALKYRREDKIPQAKKYILRCADIGNSRAMFHIGFAYWRHGGGWGLKQEYSKAPEWFKKSALLGNPAGMTFYGGCLFDGLGAERNQELGMIWAKKALPSNDLFAAGYCQFLGYCLNHGDEKAFVLFEASAKVGDEFGQRWMGFCFKEGLGVKSDNKTAFNWFLKSAEQGLALAEYDVAYMLKRGIGCEKNEELSKIWLKKAANQAYDL